MTDTELPSIAQDARAMRAYEGSTACNLLSESKSSSDDHNQKSNVDHEPEPHSPPQDYMQHGHFPRLRTPLSWMLGAHQDGSIGAARTGELGDSAKDWGRDWSTHTLSLPPYGAKVGAGSTIGSKESVGVSVARTSCSECAAATDEDDAMADGWRPVHAPQVSGFHLLQHTSVAGVHGSPLKDERNSRVVDDSVDEDLDAHAEALKLERCLTHEMLPELHRRRSIVERLQHLRHSISIDSRDISISDGTVVGSEERRSANVEAKRPADAEGPVDNAERLLQRRRTSSITDIFKAGIETFRHHVE